jgi:CRISPR/Cas system-associated exonuclease Cas4 (RecB family)
MKSIKTIDTLIDDVNALLDKGILEDIDLRVEKKEQGGNPSLRMSNIGTSCSRKLWYTLNQHGHPDREQPRPEVLMKFMYGDMVEEMLLSLVEMAGHTIEARQHEVSIEGIKGHIDCIIDGMLVDVKSASTYAFKKFKEGRLREDDPFGYYPQLMSYLYALQEDDRVQYKDRAAFLVIDKTLGHIHLDIHEKPSWFDEMPEMYKDRISYMESLDVPDRDFKPEDDGKSGNQKLGMYCSYCDFKKVCYPKLRTFLYSNGPRYLTRVRREPADTVFEVKD